MARTSTTPPADFKVTTDYLLAVVMSWLIPGAGHWILGSRFRAVALSASILGLFWVGQALAVPVEGDWKPMAVSRKVSPVFFACQVGNGFSTLLSNQVWGAPRYPNGFEPLDRQLPRHLNLAILFTAVSGLLNYLLVVHILDPRSWRRAPPPSPGGASPAAAPGDPRPPHPGKAGGT